MLNHENGPHAEFRALLRAPFTPETWQEFIRLADDVGMTAVQRIVQEPQVVPTSYPVDLDEVFADWRPATARPSTRPRRPRQ